MRCPFAHPVFRVARGLTLLESVVALVILSSVVVVSIQLRTQSLAQGRHLARVQVSHRIADDLLELAHGNILGPGTRTRPDDPTRETVWEGEHGGQPYRCVRKIVQVPDPLRHQTKKPQSEQAPEPLLLLQYTIKCGSAQVVAYKTLSRS